MDHFWRDLVSQRSPEHDLVHHVHIEGLLLGMVFVVGISMWSRARWTAVAHAVGRAINIYTVHQYNPACGTLISAFISAIGKATV